MLFLSTDFWTNIDSCGLFYKCETATGDDSYPVRPVIANTMSGPVSLHRVLFLVILSQLVSTQSDGELL